MAIKILMHTFRMIFGNFGQALKVSIGPYLILILVGAGLVLMAATTAESTVGMHPIMALAGLAIIPLVLFVTAWVAVSWHRFILKEEYAGILPAVSGRPIWPYVGKVILLGLLILAISIPVFVILSFMALPLIGGGDFNPEAFGPDFPIAAILVFAVAAIFIGFIGLRLGISLVGTAIEKPMKFGEAWQVTKPLAGTFFGVTILLVLINVLPDVLLQVVGLRVPVLGAVLSLALSWLTMMLSISILTTLYGHIVEGRPLVD